MGQQHSLAIDMQVVQAASLVEVNSSLAKG